MQGVQKDNVLPAKKDVGLIAKFYWILRHWNIMKTGGEDPHIFLLLLRDHSSNGSTRMKSHFPCLLGYSDYIGNVMTAHR